jgi:hypothetical protein
MDSTMREKVIHECPRKVMSSPGLETSRSSDLQPVHVTGAEVIRDAVLSVCVVLSVVMSSVSLSIPRFPRVPVSN